MNINEIWKFDLRQGGSNHPANGACIMNAVSWIAYGHLDDHPACACPVITAFAIRVNDMLPHDERQKLKPFIFRLMGSLDPKSENARAEYLAWQALTVFAPMALDAAGAKDWAVKLRGFDKAKGLMVAANTAISAADTAYAAANAAYDAAHAAHAAYDAVRAADATDVAYNAAHAVNTAADAAYAAAHAARSAANAAYAIDAAGSAADSVEAAADTAAYAAIHQATIDALDGVLRIGKQSSEPDQAAVMEAVAAFEKAREMA